MDNNDYIKQLLIRMREAENIVNAYSEWKEYREEFTSFILESINCIENNTVENYVGNDWLKVNKENSNKGNSNKKNASLLIIGAGACNDINLEHLANIGCSITLSDINESTMQNACSRYLVNCEIEKKDYLGLEEVDYEDFFRYMIATFSRLEANNILPTLELIENIFLKIEQKLQLNNIVSSYDYAILAGFHSQIFNKFMRISELAALIVDEKIKKIPDEVLDEVLKKIAFRVSSLNDKYIPLLNKCILNSIVKGVIIGYEISNVFIPKESIEGAYQCRQNIDKMVKEDVIENFKETELVWPFCKEERKIYNVKVICLKK